jgi:hypothetical protein
MTRTWIATAAALMLHASVVSAQVQHFTVSAASASVYKSPTNVSPVIGHATQGSTYDVTRDVGSWVKVAWSKSPDGVGYIRKAEGTMSALGPAVPPTAVTKSAAAPQSAAPASAGAAPRTVSAQTAPRVRPQPKAAPTGYVAPTHQIGVGAQVGGAAMGGGFSARGWSSKQRFGVQLDVAHYSLSNDVFFTQMSSTAIGPRLLYAFSDHVSDSTWIRPYVGLGAHVMKSSMTDPATGLAMSDTGMAAQFFGGTEVTFSAVPKLGLSAELGYQKFQTPFAGFSLNGATFGISAHWYLK